MGKKGIIPMLVICFLVCMWMVTPTLPGANVSESPFGINAHLAQDGVLAKIVQAQIKWIRIDLVWNDIESVKGQFDYSQADRVINFAQQNGLSVLAVLAYTPEWANSSRNSHAPADNVNDWKNFVQRVVLRYNDRVKYWSIWNEPNVESFYTGEKDSFVSKVFVPAAQSIKSNDAGAFIVGPDLAHLTARGEEWYFWLKYILDNAGQYISVISHHIYDDQSVNYLFERLLVSDNLIPSVKEIVEEAGHGHKPFWITETGWHTNKVSEEIQSQRYLEFLQIMRQKGFPHKIFFYEIIDDPSPGVNPYGILRSHGSEKPAFRTYVDFIAGRYPNLDPGDIPEKSKKCYAEESVANWRVRSDQMGLLQGLYRLRDEMIVQLPMGERMVRAYYHHGAEFSRLSRSDARIQTLGQGLLFDLNQLWGKRDEPISEFWHQRICEQAEALLDLLDRQPVSDDFRELLIWSRGQLKRLEKEGINRFVGHTLYESSKDNRP